MQSSSIKLTEIETGTYTMSADWAFTSADANEKWLPYSGQNTVTLAFGGTHYLNANGATGLTIEGLNITNLSAGSYPGGIYLNGASGYVFRWNTVNGCNQACMTLNSSPNALIDSNTFENQTGGSGGTAHSWVVSVNYGSSGTQLTHNYLTNDQGMGLMTQDGAADPIQNNIQMSYNLLENVGLTCNDCGALYLGDQHTNETGNTVSYNAVYGGASSLAQSTRCMYNDESESNTTWTGNICAYNGGNPPGEFGFFNHGGSNVHVTKNIFEVNSSATYTDFFGITWSGVVLYGYQTNCCSVPDTGMTGNTFTGNIVYSPGGWPGELWWISLSAPDVGPSSISTNDYYSATGAALTSYAGGTDSNPFFVDPLFSDPPAGSYLVATTSPVYPDIGWTTLPTTQGPLPYAP